MVLILSITSSHEVYTLQGKGNSEINKKILVYLYDLQIQLKHIVGRVLITTQIPTNATENKQ